MRSHEIDYEVKGSDLQMVKITLDPGETVVAEAGAMLYMDEDIRFEAKVGDGTTKGMFRTAARAASRKVSGEGLFMTHFTNRGTYRQTVSFASSIPGKIVPINLAMVGPVICQRNAFLCAALGTKVSMFFNRKLGSGMFGGEGFILQKLDGDGIALINVGGMVEERQLGGETIKVDTGCLVGFQEGLNYSIGRAGNLKSMLFGGEGMFLATISGHGRVWIQSLPYPRLAEPIIQAAASRVAASQSSD